jgi:hypothetical protein
LSVSTGSLFQAAQASLAQSADIITGAANAATDKHPPTMADAKRSDFCIFLLPSESIGEHSG